MRKLRLFKHISVDGVIQHTPDENGFPYGDWTVPLTIHVGEQAEGLRYRSLGRSPRTASANDMQAVGLR